MDEIDQNCWILEPEHPTRADASRRVALGEDFAYTIMLRLVIYVLYSLKIEMDKDFNYLKIPAKL